MSVRTRVERLERDQGDQGDQVVDVVALFWPEETPEERKAILERARARVASGQYEPGKLYWRDGTEASAP